MTDNEIDNSASEMERIDEDPNAETDDTRVRVESGENGTYVLRRERYSLVEFETETMADDGDAFERYDWHTDEKFVLRGDSEAKQFSSMLSDEGAFDPNVLFFRQRDWSNNCDEDTDTDCNGDSQ